MVKRLGILSEKQVLTSIFVRRFANLWSSNVESLYDIAVCDCLHQL